MGYTHVNIYGTGTTITCRRLHAVSVSHRASIELNPQLICNRQCKMGQIILIADG